MLILRVASGRAWSNSTVARTNIDPVRFERGHRPTTTATGILTTAILDDQVKSVTVPDEESGPGF